MKESLGDVLTPLSPRRISTQSPVKLWRTTGCHAVVGAKNMPYITDIREIKLKEIEVAIGAPIKPRRIGPGPHTTCKEER
jgi:hypothetical protein